MKWTHKTHQQTLLKGERHDRLHPRGWSTGAENQTVTLSAWFTHSLSTLSAVTRRRLRLKATTINRNSNIPVLTGLIWISSRRWEDVYMLITIDLEIIIIITNHIKKPKRPSGPAPASARNIHQLQQP